MSLLFGYPRESRLSSTDANEQFNSRHRCCEACRQRQVKVKDKDGGVTEVTEYYHYQV